MKPISSIHLTSLHQLTLASHTAKSPDSFEGKFELFKSRLMTRFAFVGPTAFVACLGAASIFLVASVARADSLRGFITIQGTQILLMPVSNMTPVLPKPIPVQTTLGIRASLLDLKSGDFIVAAGRLEDFDHDGVFENVTIQAIESVGLQDLIGTWRSEKWEVIRFEDFTRISLYRPRFHPQRHLNLAKLKELNYTLAPGLGSSYSIFLVEKRASGPAPIYVGRLSRKLGPKGLILELEILDPSTGEVSEVLSLSPVRE